MTDTTAGNITDLKEDDNSGSAIGFAASYDATDYTITLNPSSDLSEGDVVYAAISNSWYYSDGGNCWQGSAANATITADTTGPTVVSGSTGYYADSGLTTALTGSVAPGVDVYTKYTFSEAMGETVADDATARPELSSVVAVAGGKRYIYAGSASDITLDNANTNAQGVVANASGIYVVDDGTTDKVYAYNLDGTRNSAADVTLDNAASNPDGIAMTATHFLVLGSGTNGVRGYTLAGVRDSTKTSLTRLAARTRVLLQTHPVYTSLTAVAVPGMSTPTRLPACATVVPTSVTAVSVATRTQVVLPVPPMVSTYLTV